MSYLIVFQSSTQAQNAVSILNRSGVMASMTKPPLSLGKGSCSHGVKIAAADFNRARNLLRGSRTAISGAWRVTPQGRYEEVAF